MTPEKLNLKRATQETIRGVGGVEAAAEFCRVGKSVLADNYSPNKPDSFVALDVIADLEPLARGREGWPAVTGLLCRQMGGMFVARPDVRATGADLLTLLARHAQESADVSRATCEAVADGRVCPGDAAKIRREVESHMEMLAGMHAALVLIETEGC